MNLAKSICESVCSGFSVKEVPMGFAIKSPFDWFLGDPLTFYARFEKGRARFEDSGTLVADLEAMGVDFSSSSRRAILDNLLAEHNVVFDEEDWMFVTHWVTASDLPNLTAKFIAFLSRVQDLLFLNRDRVENTFKEDLTTALTAKFKDDAEIILGEAPVESLPDSVVDIVVKTRAGKVLAIFPATAEVHALAAMLFAKELEVNHIDNVTPFIVFENFDTARISQRTRARAINSPLEMAAWNGGKTEVVNKIARYSGLMN